MDTSIAISNMCTGFVRILCLFMLKLLLFSGKRQRDNDDDTIPASENYRPEDALEHVQDSKGTDIPKPFTAKKKLGEGDYGEEGNIVSSTNIFADRVRYLFMLQYCL
jgi:hypothetical protein